MAQVIVYPNKETGGIIVLFPVLECGLTIDQIAAKDVPSGLPYFYMDQALIPTGNDALFPEAWEADFSNPTGTGANYGVGSMQCVVGWNTDGTPILRQEQEIQ